MRHNVALFMNCLEDVFSETVLSVYRVLINLAGTEKSRGC